MSRSTEDDVSTTEALNLVLGVGAGQLRDLSMDHGQSQRVTGSQPYLEITEQPQQRGFRFRYKCEGPSHGGIPGADSVRGRKSYPTVKIHNYTGPARIVVTLVTEDSFRIHAHELVGRHCRNGIGVIEIKGGEMKAMFPNLGVMHTTKRNLQQELEERVIESMKCEYLAQYGQLEDNYELLPDKVRLAKEQAAKIAKDMTLSSVRLCFKAYLRDENGHFTNVLEPVMSDPIFDNKSPGSSNLKICRMDKYGCCCTGDVEVFLLCEKVQKDDINVLFIERDERGNVVWEGCGNFGPSDVHRQYAIVFRTPAYRDPHIKQAVHVTIQLKRQSDGQMSDPKSFTYFPQQSCYITCRTCPPDKDGLTHKRRKPLPQSLSRFGENGGEFFGGNNHNDHGNTGNGYPSSWHTPPPPRHQSPSSHHNRRVEKEEVMLLPCNMQTLLSDLPPSTSDTVPYSLPYSAIDSPPYVMSQQYSSNSNSSGGSDHYSIGNSPPYPGITSSSGNQMYSKTSMSPAFSPKRSPASFSDSFSNSNSPISVNQQFVTGTSKSFTSINPALTLTNQPLATVTNQPFTTASNQPVTGVSHRPFSVVSNQSFTSMPNQHINNIPTTKHTTKTKKNQTKATNKPYTAKSNQTSTKPNNQQLTKVNAQFTTSTTSQQQFAPTSTNQLQMTPQLTEQLIAALTKQQVTTNRQFVTPTSLQTNAPQPSTTSLDPFPLPMDTAFPNPSPPFAPEQPSFPTINDDDLAIFDQFMQSYAPPTTIIPKSEPGTYTQASHVDTNPHSIMNQTLHSLVFSDTHNINHSPQMIDTLNGPMNIADQQWDFTQTDLDLGDLLMDHIPAHVPTQSSRVPNLPRLLATATDCGVRTDHEQREIPLHDSYKHEKQSVKPSQPDDTNVTSTSGLNKPLYRAVQPSDAQIDHVTSSTTDDVTTTPVQETPEVKKSSIKYPPTTKPKQQPVAQDKAHTMTRTHGIQLAMRLTTALWTYAATGDIKHLLMAQRHLLLLADNNRDTVLHMAVIHENQWLLRQLLIVMATLPDHDKINSPNLLSQTPLHLAVLTKQPKLVDILLQHEADPTLTDRDGNTACHLATALADVHSVQLLCRSWRPGVEDQSPYSDLEVFNHDGLTPLHMAVNVGSLPCVKELIQSGVDVDIGDRKSGRTALHYAAENGDVAMAGCLLMEGNADVNAMTFDHNTPLHIACGKRLLPMVALLMGMGANPYLENDEGYYRDYLPSDDEDEEQIAATQWRGCRPADLSQGHPKIERMLRDIPYTSPAPKSHPQPSHKAFSSTLDDAQLSLARLSIQPKLQPITSKMNDFPDDCGSYDSGISLNS